MKKIFITIVLSIMFCLFLKSPSLVKADSLHEFGTAWIKYNNQDVLVDLFVYTNPPYTYLYYDSGTITLRNQDSPVWWDAAAGYYKSLSASYTYAVYASGLTSYDPIPYFGRNIYVYGSFDDFEDDLPDALQRSAVQKIWDDFLHFVRQQLGVEPGPIYELLYDLALGDRDEDTEITFPTLTPSPTPTPTPTPIPVQTIFVPDGNGNTTIIYQYPDPTTGVITQSPYNPNTTTNITVDCNCDGGSGNDNNPFSSSPQDPYTLDASLLWADGFGVQMSDNPLSIANDSQTSLKGAAEEYSSSVEVVSNSFNVLPIKWLTLVGLLGGILIIAGLIRTFLGG